MNQLDPVREEYRRGIQLYQLRRFADAEAAFHRVLALQPQHNWALHMLGTILAMRVDRRAEALTFVREAIGIAPGESEHHELHSEVLCELNRLDEAKHAADEAIRIDPHSPAAFVARGLAELGLDQKREAEQSAREALRLDPSDAAAHHILINALRLQGKHQEQTEAALDQLHRDPGNPTSHTNVGWAFLESGNINRAQEHFREALRVSPHFDWARQGLLSSLRAQSQFFRFPIRVFSWMEKRKAKYQWSIIIGAFLVARLARAWLSPGLNWLGQLAEITLIASLVWLWASRSVGNVFLQLNSFGRLATSGREKTEAYLVTALLTFGTGFIGGGFARGSTSLTLIGTLMILLCMPTGWALTRNGPRIGIWLAGALAAVAWIEVISILRQLGRLDSSHSLNPLALVTFLPAIIHLAIHSAVPFLRRTMIGARH